MAHVDGNILIGGIGLMFFFAYNAYQLRSVGSEDGYNEAISMFLILMSFVTAWSVMNTMGHVVLGSTHEIIEKSTSITYWISVVSGTVLLAYFALRLIVGSWKVAFKKKGGFSE